MKVVLGAPRNNRNLKQVPQIAFLTFGTKFSKYAYSLSFVRHCFGLGSYSMLFVIVIRNRYRSHTRKIVNLVFYAHRYRKVVSKIRYELTNHAEKYRRLQSCRYLVLSRIYSWLAVDKMAVPYFALNSTSILDKESH